MKRLLIVLLCATMCLMCGCGLFPTAETISVEEFMYYHTVEEIADYWREYDSPSNVAETFNEEWWDMYFLTEDQANEAINKAYARGYLDGATDTSGVLDEAVKNEDFERIYEYTSYSFHMSDFID